MVSEIERQIGRQTQRQRQTQKELGILRFMAPKELHSDLISLSEVH